MHIRPYCLFTLPQAWSESSPHRNPVFPQRWPRHACGKVFVAAMLTMACSAIYLAIRKPNQQCPRRHFYVLSDPFFARLRPDAAGPNGSSIGRHC
jgi:hypothetical protein